MRRVPLSPGLPHLAGDDHERIIVTRSAVPVASQAAAPILRIVLDGHEDWEIDGRRYHLTPGHILLVPAGAMMSVKAGERTRSLSMELRPSDATGLEGAVVLPLASHAAGAWAEQLARQLHLDDAESLAVAREALDDLSCRIHALAENCLERSLASTAAKHRTRLDLLIRVEAARAVLTANLHRTVPLWELAEAASLSQFHLNRAFREICRVSPAALHRRLRMEAAAEMLVAGDAPVTVARSLGFSTQASFTRAFVQANGCPPGQYRAAGAA